MVTKVRSTGLPTTTVNNSTHYDLSLLLPQVGDLYESSVDLFGILSNPTYTYKRKLRIPTSTVTERKITERR